MCNENETIYFIWFAIYTALLCETHDRSDNNKIILII